MATNEWIDVTPALARQWLAEVPFLQVPSPAAVHGLAKDMLDGRWFKGVSPLIRCTDGRLLDGRTRLTALVLADVTLRFMVVTMSPEEAQSFTTQRRSLAL
jgi:hypothetical protein